MERRHHGRGGDEGEVLDWEREGRPKEGRGWRPKRGGKLGFPYGRLPTWASWAKACGPGWRIFTEIPFSLIYSLFSLLNLLMNIAQIPSPNNILPNLCLGYYKFATGGWVLVMLDGGRQRWGMVHPGFPEVLPFPP